MKHETSSTPPTQEEVTTQDILDALGCFADPEALVFEEDTRTMEEVGKDIMRTYRERSPLFSVTSVGGAQE